MKTKNKHYSISFVGQYELTVLDDQRLILPSDVVRQLEDHGIEKVLAGRLPGFNALVLCPEALWGEWLKKLRRDFPAIETYDGARSFFTPWRPIGWDSKGRISLPRRARNHLGINAHDTAILVGTGFYFELWSEEEFNRITQDCELALREIIQPPPSVSSGMPIARRSPRSPSKSHHQRGKRPS